MLKTILKPVYRLNFDNTVPIALLVAGALWLASVPPDERTFALMVFLWMVSVLALLSGFAKTVCTYEPCTLERPRSRPQLLQRLVYWVGAGALLTASAVLFAAGHPVLAMVPAVHLFGRLAIGAMWFEQSLDVETIKRNGMIRFKIAAGATLTGMAAGLLWIGFGAPPGWAASLIVAAWWLVLLTLLLTASIALWTSVDNPLPYRLSARIFRLGNSSAERGGIPEISVNLLLSGYCLFVIIALAAAGMYVPAGLAILSLLLFRAESAQRKLIEAADAGRPPRLGWLSRANHFVVTNAVQLVFSPVQYVSKLLGIGTAKEAAELRKAFGRPDGFIYFLWSEPLQRVPYLEQGGLLEPYAGHVVERNWRRDIMEAVDGAGGKAAARTAERRLLARHDILRKGTPFLVVVPPKGSPRAVRLAGRGFPRWWNGDPGTQTIEFSVLSAVTKAFGPRAGLPAGMLLLP